MTIADGEVTGSILTSGWGTVGLDSSAGLPSDPPTMAPWPDWTLAGIPDGAVATVLAALIGLAGIRVLLVGARAGRPAAAAIAGTGLLGLVWMALSSSTAHGVVRDFEEIFVMSGVAEQEAHDALSGQVGWGFVVSAVAFAVAAGAGTTALWSATTGAPIEPLAGPEPTPNATPAAPAPPGDRPMPSWESPLPPVPPVVADGLGRPREPDAPRTDGRPPSPPGWR
ncbi:MAG TPA: hypothetical protein VGO60_03890 [Iamia sp.]|nr:hypothetical protein [Iamia sp.]